MILHLLRLRPTRPLSKPNIEIRARTKDASVACHDDALDAPVDVEHGVRGLDFLAHGVCKGIVVLGAVEREDYDRRFFFMVLRADLRELEIVV